MSKFHLTEIKTVAMGLMFFITKYMHRQSLPEKCHMQSNTGSSDNNIDNRNNILN